MAHVFPYHRQITPEIVQASRPFEVWKCAECGTEARATAHQMRRTYCSKSCMALGYAKRLKGKSNPNFKSAAPKICATCDKEYNSYSKTSKYCSLTCRNPQKTEKPLAECPKCNSGFKRKTSDQKYCSQECYKAAKAKPKKNWYQPRPRAKNLKNCEHCSKEFHSAKSSARKFCSYECFLDSGGAQRAGDAAAMAKRAYGGKKDANHHEIFDALSKLIPVRDLSDAGCGVPDGIAWIKDGWHLFDVKNLKTGYGRRGLNPRQRKWADDWRGGAVYLIHDVDEAILFATGRFDQLKKFPEDNRI